MADFDIWLKEQPTTTSFDINLKLGRVYRWTGTAWELVDVQRRNATNTAWESAPVKRWNGTFWEG
jgi:hypothetical protein